MTNFAIRLTDKDVFTFLKRGISSVLVTECGKCGAVKINSRSLNGLLKETETLDDETQEIFDEILWKLIEPEPSFEEIKDWDKRDSENGQSSGTHYLIKYCCPRI